MMGEEDVRLHKPQPALFTEYPFFRDGMTLTEFDEEQRYWMEFFASGGKRENYRTLWQQRRLKAGDPQQQPYGQY